MQIVTAASTDLDAEQLRALRALFLEAFVDGFTPEDFDHALGGIHVMAVDDGEVVAHASAVPRTIVVGDRAFATGYGEAVATSPARQGTGIGRRVMETLNPLIQERWEFGALATGSHGFYERLGWERWRGPSYVITEHGTERSAEEDDGLMVLRFGPSADVELTSSITCYDRPGDAW